MALVLASHLTFAQGTVPGQGSAGVTAPRGNGSIAGTVVDAASQQPVGFATITLADPNSGKPIDGALCDEKGKFKINNIGAGNYRVVVSFIGYETRNIDNVRLAANNSDVNLGSIKVNISSTVLKEVEVQGQRALIEEKVDRTVYNAENDATNRGGDATDVLRKVPSLSVDLDGNVTLRGSQNIRVLINNRPSTIAAGSVADALKQIPSDMIKSVEVITSPSAKYDAEGSGGIINIITKKNNLQGFSLNIDGSAGLRGSNLGLNGSYRVGKMGFSLGGHGRGNYNTPGIYNNRQVTTNEGVQTLNIQDSESQNKGLFGRYQFGWDYDIDKYNFLSASVQYGVRNGNNLLDNLHRVQYRNDALLSETLQDQETTDNSGNVDVNLNYTRTFAKPQQEFSILTQFSRNNRTNDILINNFDLLDYSIDSRRQNLNESSNQEITLQADYQTPIGETQFLEFGAKDIIRQVNSDYATFTADGATGAFIRNTNAVASNVFDYTQNITAGYVSYTLNIAKEYTIKAGTRYEYTTIDANFENGSALSIPSYGALVPSLNLSRKLANGNLIKLAYNRRIQRPSLQFLNPNRLINGINVTEGNPELDPEYTNNFEVGYNTYVNTTSLNFSAFARNTNNSIQSIRDILAYTLPDGSINSDTIRTTYNNIGKEDAYGISLFANVNISGKLSLNGGTDMYYAVLNNNVADARYAASNQGLVYNVRAFGNYSIGKGWGLQMFGFYRGSQIQLQGSQSGFGIYSLSLRKELFDKKGSIGFGAENFLTNSITMRNRFDSPILNQVSSNEMFNRNFKVNFSYRIGKLNMNDTRRRRKSVNNDDLKGGGEGGGQDASTQQSGSAPTGGATQTGGASGGGARSNVGGVPGQGQQPSGSMPATTAPVTAPDSAATGIAPDSTQSIPGQAGNINGRWTGKLGQFDMTLNLQANAGQLTGTVETPRGTNPITDGKINNNDFSFNLSFNGNTIPYRGKLDGNIMTLIVNLQGQDVTGTLNRVE